MSDTSTPTPTRKPRRGRPAFEWLPPRRFAALEVGTAVCIELSGGHSKRLVGRITSHGRAATTVHSPLGGEVSIARRDVVRARVVDALYEPGDPVLQRGVEASEWRGGVVSTSGTEVLVEQIDGTFAWLGEHQLEPAEVRDPAPPKLRRGPVPARVS